MVRTSGLTSFDVDLRFHKFRKELNILLPLDLIMIRAKYNALLLFLSLADVSLYFVRYVEKVLLGYLLKKLLIGLVLHVYVHEVSESFHVRDYAVDDLCKFEVAP